MMDAASILAELARAAWYDAHGCATCPPDRIPTEADLLTWWRPADASDPAHHEACSRLDAVLAGRTFHGLKLGAGWEWTALRHSVTADDAPPESEVCFAAAMRSRGFAGGSPGAGDYLAAFDVVAVHERWLELPEADRPLHPLAPVVAAWQARPIEVEPDRRDNAIIQYGLFHEAPAGARISGLRDHSNLLLAPGPVHELEPQLMMFGEDAGEVGTAPLLMLADAAGFTALQQGRGARIDKRILLYSLLKVPRKQRCPGGSWTLREPGFCIVRELWAPNDKGISSYRPGKHGQALTQGFDALSIAKVTLADGALWRPAVTRQSPNPHDLDTDYIIEFRFPDDCARGAMVHRPSLIADGMVSDPAFDLCLSLAFLWDKVKAQNGGRRVYSTRPKAKRDRGGVLLDREGKPIMGAPGSPRTGKDGKLTWPAAGRNGKLVPMKDWRHPSAVLDGTERHPAADKVPSLSPDERRKLAYGDTRRRDKGQHRRDRLNTDRLLLKLEADGRIAIEAPRDVHGLPLSRFEWRILEIQRP